MELNIFSLLISDYVREVHPWTEGEGEGKTNTRNQMVQVLYIIYTTLYQPTA